MDNEKVMAQKKVLRAASQFTFGISLIGIAFSGLVLMIVSPFIFIVSLLVYSFIGWFGVFLIFLPAILLVIHCFKR